MSPAELLSGGDHLAACGACRERVLEAGRFGDEPRRLWAELQAEDETGHLSYEQLASYAAGSLDEFDRIVVDSHIEVCTSCSEEAKDLLEFSRRVGQTPASASRVEMLPPPVINYRRWPARLSATRVAAAAVLLFMFVAAGLFTFRRGSETGGRTDPQTHPQTHPEVSRADAPSSNAAPPSGPTPIQVQNSSQPQGVGQGQSHAGVGKADRQRALSGAAPASDRVAVALLDGGRRVILDGVGGLRGLDALPPGARKTLRAALLSREVRKPSVVAELYGESSTLLGDSLADGGLKPVGPVGTVVLGTRPTFRWTPLDGAAGYVVEVYDPELRPVATSNTLMTTEWTVEKPLRGGVVYRWQVTALKGGERIRAPKPPAPEAKFKVLEEVKAAELADIERLAPGSHLALGVLYARAGLADDSERELRLLLKENPRSNVAKRMLESVRDWRR